MTSRIGGVSGSFVYGRSWQWALLVAVMISWGAMNIIAITFEHRTLLNPRGQYLGYYLGDLICLPGLVLTLRYLSYRVSDRSHFWQNSGWHMTVFVVGVVVGIMFHRVEANGGVYSEAQMWSATKLYHDLVVFPLFIYVLVSALPVLFAAAAGPKPRVIAVVLLAAFTALNVYDMNRPPAPNAHVPIDVRRTLHLKP